MFIFIRNTTTTVEPTAAPVVVVFTLICIKSLKLMKYEVLLYEYEYGYSMYLYFYCAALRRK